jgi:hypothetical protein
MFRAIARASEPAAMAVLIFACAVAGNGPALAGPVEDNAARAETLLAEGKAQDAVAAFDQATDAFWNASPLTFRTAVLADRIQSYGDYLPRSAAPFKAGDAALVYLEPIGFGWAAEGDGFKARLETDVEIRSTGGLIMGKAAKFGSVERTSREKIRELNLSVRLPLPALKPGDYELMLTVRDLVSGKSGTVSLPLTLGE